MPTTLDNAMKSKNLVMAFGGAVVAATIWSIWGGDMFPAQQDPEGNPENWTRKEMRRWLAARNLFPQESDTREELLARVLANMRIPRRPPRAIVLQCALFEVCGGTIKVKLPGIFSPNTFASLALVRGSRSSGYGKLSRIADDIAARLWTEQPAITRQPPKNRSALSTSARDPYPSILRSPTSSMAFLEDPRLRQRWNQIAHDAETVTENAAAGIWTFQHNYINPCLGSMLGSVEQCTALCLGDPEERLRRQRERARGRTEYSFNFYDDWDQDQDEEGGGLLGGWTGEDWDRLLAGAGTQRRVETAEQPRRKRGMSYGTSGVRRMTGEIDPTIIPSTQPIGFLSRLPWRVGRTLRYKPSAADLQDHPGTGKLGNAEAQPLLGSDDESDDGELCVSRSRKRSGTMASGGTSDSYRSRGDLFPSDGEGEEDAIPLDDEVTYDMVRKDDRSSKGKRPVDAISRTVSRTTLGSFASRESPSQRGPSSVPPTLDAENSLSLQDLQMEEECLERKEDEGLANKQAAAPQPAMEKGLQAHGPLHSAPEPKLPDVALDEGYQPDEPRAIHLIKDEENDDDAPDDPRHSQHKLSRQTKDLGRVDEVFVPARLPHFG